MKHWHGKLGTALLLACMALPQAWAGDIYKCTINGATVYRDQPCAPGQPDAGRLSKAEDPPIIVNESSAGALKQGIRQLEKREREQHAQYNRETDRLHQRPPMSDVRDLHAMLIAEQQSRQLDRKWQKRFAETRRQRQDLLERLRTSCPHGKSRASDTSRCDR